MLVYNKTFICLYAKAYTWIGDLFCHISSSLTYLFHEVCTSLKYSVRIVESVFYYDSLPIIHYT